MEGRPEPYLADEAEAIAKLYRRLVLLVGAQILLSVVIRAMGLGATQGATSGLILIAILGFAATIATSVLIAITAYQLTGRLRSGLPILWAIAMFVPCINIIALLALSSSAQSWCRRHGIKVGFLGPTKESIEEIRRRSATSAFD